MTVTLTMAERGELIVECRGLIVKLAVKFWKQTSPETKAWTTPDDFIEDCYLQLLTAFAEYDGTYSPTTFVWRVLSNYLEDKQKFRHNRGRDSLKSSSSKFGGDVAEERTQTLPVLDSVGQPDAELRLLVLKEAMGHLYSMASPGLQNSLQHWFSDARTCINVKQRLFGERADEFRSLAVHCGINRDDCLVLMRSNFILKKRT